MNRHIAALLLAILWVSISTSALAQSSYLRVVGVASPVKKDGSISQRVAYREQHHVSPQQHTVLYTDAQGLAIARKQISYLHGYTTPEYSLQDLVHHRRSGSEWQNNNFLIYQQDARNLRAEKVVQPNANTVIDSGFDHFIRKHWAELIDGKILPMSLVVADPLTTLHMNIAEVSAAQTAIPQHSERYRYFLVGGSNPLTRWVIPALHLAYDRDSHLLQIYQGPSNIPDREGKVQTVNIQYSYTLPAVSASMPAPPLPH